MQSQCVIDHLVVRAATLDAGAEYVRAALRVELGPGDKHERMGTTIDCSNSVMAVRCSDQVQHGSIFRYR
jgi:hypothetical protein